LGGEPFRGELPPERGESGLDFTAGNPPFFIGKINEQNKHGNMDRKWEMIKHQFF
jgi:hypothetical protein